MDRGDEADNDDGQMMRSNNKPWGSLLSSVTDAVEDKNDGMPFKGRASSSSNEAAAALVIIKSSEAAT